MMIIVLLLMPAYCPAGYGFGRAYSPQSSGVTFQAGSLIIPTDDCYQHGLDNATWYGPSTNALVSEQWATDSSACTYYDSTTTPSTLTAPDFAPATGGGSHCWAASTAGYGATAGAMLHTYGLAYLLAKNEIPVHVLLSPNKLGSAEPDAVVPAVSASVNGVYYLSWSAGAYSAAELTPMAGASVYYRGAPFVVDAAFAQQALAYLTAQLGAGATMFRDVKIHVSRTAFTAPVVGILDTTPKPLGLVNYSNTNGYQSTMKLLNDAGIGFTLGGEGGAWTTIVGDSAGNAKYTWAGSPSTGTNACVAGNCTSLTYTPTAGLETRILDAVWMPSVEAPDVILNPAVCTGAQGQCLADACLGPNATCCYDPVQPALATLPPGTTAVPVPTPTGTVNYYCPCDLTPVQVDCVVNNYRYNFINSLQYRNSLNCWESPWPSTTPSANPCSVGYQCDVSTSHCLIPCVTDTDCGGTVGSCVTMPDDAFSGLGAGQVACTGTALCPAGYTCTLATGVCSPSSKMCNPLVEATTCGGCNADEYCDPVTNHCETRTGCAVSCIPDPPTQGDTVWNNWAAPVSGMGGVNNLITTGGAFFATDQTINDIEYGANRLLLALGAGYADTSFSYGPGGPNGASAPFCANSISADGTTIAATYQSGWAWSSRPASNMALQIGDFLPRLGWQQAYFKSEFTGSSPQTQVLAQVTGNVFKDTALAQVGPGPGGLLQGTVVEALSNNFVSQGTVRPDQWAGQHLLLTGLTLLNGTAPGCNGNTLTTTELVRGSPMPGPFTGAWASEYYVGSYEWGWTAPTVAGQGNAQWSPAWDAYPYAIGHFRQYTLGSGADTNTALGAGSWDTDCWLKTGASDCTGSTAPARTIWTAYWTGTAWSMVPMIIGNLNTIASQMFGTPTPNATQLSQATAVINRVSTTTRLGGINYSVPAVVPHSQGLVAAGTGRPTLAYVGGWDGMLHAICVAAAAGSPASPGTCYGQPAGAEVFAFIPPQTLTDMGIAVGAHDWSRIAVDGVMRVADVFDKLSTASPGTNVWQTVLLLGTRGSGAIDALVISNPDPANVNTDNLRMLWEMNASNTAPAPGPTQGATIVVPSITARAAVTAATQGGNGMTAYLLQIAPAAAPQTGPVVVATQSVTYTKKLPIQASLTAPAVVPPMPTVVGLISSTIDDTLLVATVEGQMMKYPLTPTTLGAGTLILDVSAWASGAGTAARTPILSSPAVARRPLAAGGPADPQFVMIATTGGTDLADQTSTAVQYMVGADVEVSTPAATPWFYGSLGTAAMTQPNYPPQPVTYPQLGYGQPIVYGAAVAVTATALHFNNPLWPLFPNIYGGVWGLGELFDITGINTSNTVTSASPFTTGAGGAFGGAAGSAMLSNGRIVLVGGSQVYDHGMTAAETTLTQPQSLLKIVSPSAGGGPGRSFTEFMETEPDR
jgi:hypothetical protein